MNPFQVRCANCRTRMESTVVEVDCTTEGRSLIELVEKRTRCKQHSYLTMIMLADVFKGANNDKMRSQNLTSETAYGIAKPLDADNISSTIDSSTCMKHESNEKINWIINEQVFLS